MKLLLKSQIAFTQVKLIFIYQFNYFSLQGRRYIYPENSFVVIAGIDAKYSGKYHLQIGNIQKEVKENIYRISYLIKRPGVKKMWGYPLKKKNRRIYTGESGR